jgi:nucleoside 2-deoxyribosyltransferase
MAFGRDDCDKIYSKQILPTLRSLNLNPIRVDRRQHPDDLNNFIIRMLKNSSIVLADLTYARPSVYYEAGFAERKTPVVYTVRKDHLSRAQRDERLRVHFDLEMKKIVDWLSPDDPTFQSRLKTRMRYMLRPVHTQMEREEREETDEREFLTLSVAERCEAILRQFVRQLRAKRFWFRPLCDVDPSAHRRIFPARAVIGAKMDGRKAVSATVVTAGSITRKQIEAVLCLATGSHLTAPRHRNAISQFDEHVFFCSLSRLPTSRLTSLLPHARPDTRSGCFDLSQAATKYDKCRKTTIWLLGPLSSERKAADAAVECMRRIGDRKTNDYTSIATFKPGNQGWIVFERPKKPQPV